MVSPFLALLTKIVNSRTSHDIDMKLGPVPKLDKRKKKRKTNDDAVLANCDANVIFPIYGIFAAISRSWIKFSLTVTF